MNAIDAAARALYDDWLGPRRDNGLTFDIAYPEEQDDFRNGARMMIEAWLGAGGRDETVRAWLETKKPLAEEMVAAWLNVGLDYSAAQTAFRNLTGLDDDGEVWRIIEAAIMTGRLS